MTMHKNDEQCEPSFVNNFANLIADDSYHPYRQPLCPK